jgi:hypothetical protein
VLAGRVGEQKHHECFVQLCLVARLLRKAKNYDMIPVDLILEIHRGLSHHQKSFVEVYGEENCKPKHHYSLHLSKQLERDRILLDTFVHERKHRLIKQTYDCLRLVPDGVAKILVTRVNYCQLWQEDNKQEFGLLGRLAPCPELLTAKLPGVDFSDVKVSERVSTVNGLIRCDDVAFLDGFAVKVLSCFGAPGSWEKLLVAGFVKLRAVGNAAYWAPSTTLRVVPTTQVTLVWNSM